MDEPRDDILGQGRSGRVYLTRNSQGQPVARKVFGGDWQAHMVHVLLLGAPNPYIWCEDAIRCALLRRQILAELAPLWLPGKLRVAGALQYQWNPTQRAYELVTEFIRGRHAALHHPFTDQRGYRHLFSAFVAKKCACTPPREHSPIDETCDLYFGVMKPLQRRLEQAGFDGLVWQAGRGNPVALNNFMQEQPGSWVWIDLESGVPALFPANPLQLLKFYLPKSIRHRTPLFDDVDIPRLRCTLDRHQHELGRRTAHLAKLVDELHTHQLRWKTLRRIDRSVTYQLKKGRIAPDQADWYRNHAVIWYLLLLAYVTKQASRKLWHRACWSFKWLCRRPYRQYALNVALFLVSQQFRRQIAQRYVGGRIDQWVGRSQLTQDQATYLHRHLKSEEASAYLCDFGMHLAVKPPVKLVTYGLVPTLVATGLIGPHWLAITIALCGATARTLYTLGRLIQATLGSQEKPWVALFVGVLPIIGNVAYPLQILYCGTERDHELARFVFYDTFSRLGQKLPIWGGPDTLTEHLANRLPDIILHWRAPATRLSVSSPSPDTAL